MERGEGDDSDFDLDTELGLIKVMAQMGSVGTMMDLLINATFHLGDTDKDDRLSKAEALRFAEMHLAPAGAKLGAALGLHGGHVPLSDAGLTGGVEAVFKLCDTSPADGFITRDEAQGCKLGLHAQLEAISRKRAHGQARAPQPTNAGGVPAKGGGPAGAGARDASGGADAARQQAAHQMFLEARQRVAARAAAQGAGAAGGEASGVDGTSRRSAAAAGTEGGGGGGSKFRSWKPVSGGAGFRLKG